MKKPITDKAFSDFLGISVSAGNKNAITFSKADLELPFISHDEAMWDYFEPELSRRLAKLDVDDSMSARVRGGKHRAGAAFC